MSNFRAGNDDDIIQRKRDKSTFISDIIDVGTNGKKILDDVNATVVVSKGRTIRINLADKDTQHHFMGQQIYGIVKKIVY